MQKSTQLKNTQNTPIKHNPKSKQLKNRPKQNLPGSVAFYAAWPGNEKGLLYNAPKHTGQLSLH